MCKISIHSFNKSCHCKCSKGFVKVFLRSRDVVVGSRRDEGTPLSRPLFLPPFPLQWRPSTGSALGGRKGPGTWSPCTTRARTNAVLAPNSPTLVLGDCKMKETHHYINFLHATCLMKECKRCKIYLMTPRQG